MWMLANEAIEKTTWYPLTLGWLVVLSGIGMFFGSTYLLLSTNLGSRLGFLIVGAISAGFIVILSLLWVTTATPLNVFKGRQVEWKPVAVVQDVGSANIEDVRNIKQDGTKLTSTEFANVKAAADTLLAAPAEGSTVEKPAAVADDLPTVDVIVTDIYEIGGSSPNPLHFQFRHTPQYAAVQFCQLDKEKSATAFRSTCDTSAEAQANNRVLILEKDLGSLRQPPLFLFFGASALFALFLMALHWRDKDLKAAQADKSSDGDDSNEDEKETSSEDLVDA